MKRKSIRMQFEAAALPDSAIRCLSDVFDRQDFNGNTSTVNLCRVMTFRDPYYGKVELTKQKFQKMISNFEKNVYGQKLFIDVSHAPSDGAAAEITGLRLEGMRFVADVSWTPYGLDAVKNKGFCYLSIDFSDNYVDPENETEHGPTLFGAGLTIRPRVKRLNPIQLSFDQDQTPMLLSLRVKKILQEEIDTMFKKYLKKLQEALAGLALSEKIVNQYVAQFEKVGAQLGDNEEALQGVVDAFTGTATQLAENPAASNSNITLDFSQFSLPAARTALSAEDVRRILAEDRQATQQAENEANQRLAANVTLFNSILDADTNLPESVRTQLGESADLITSEMNEDQVRRFAEKQLSLGNQWAASAQLSAMGYQPNAQGRVQISPEERNNGIALQEHINSQLRNTTAFRQREIGLAETDREHPFVTMVLAQYDALNAPRIALERKMFAAGSTAIGDTNLPVGFQRTVIREALQDLRVLDMVQTLTDFAAQGTTQIPYEKRDASAVHNKGVVYEGQPIHRASVTQAMDLAYVVPMKIAFIISNEVMHFSRASALNWDAYARNVESNARVLRELLAMRICNEMQRSADAYLATAVVQESFATQLNGTSVSTIKTANYPIVRPHQEYDLAGNTVGAVENPITVRLNNVVISEYDGTGTQSAGTYYRVTNYNLGYVQFVDETGAAVFPPDAAGAEDISYSYATNVVKFDLDNGSVEVEKHLNGLLRAIGGRRALLAQDRFVTPNFTLMSQVMHDTVTNAEQFTSANKKNGTDTNVDGDLDRVKGVPAWGTNAPNVDLGDERIILGQRGVLTYTIAKPFETGAPFEVVNSNGIPTGQKQAYGEEYNAIKVPIEIRKNMTSVLAYSFSNR